jgi:alkaline phosphatase D
MATPFLTRRSFAGAALTTAIIGPLAAQPKPLVRVAFGSCVDPREAQPIWDSVLAYKPDLFIFGGDNVYGDSKDRELKELKEAYALARQSPGYMKLRQSVRHLATWDDHDYGVNDAGGDMPFKVESKEEFLRFWDAPTDDPRRLHEGIYYAESFGTLGQRAQVILLDIRSFKSPWKPTENRGAPGMERYLPDEDPAKTMLGPAQWTWLAERLREPADLRLVVSSIQVLADGHGWERWGNFPRERRKLYELIRQTRAENVIFLSGDRHLGALYRETNGTPYPLTEMTSSGLTKYFPNSREPGPNRLGTVFGRANFGTIDIDWWEKKVRLSVRDEAGQPVRSHGVPMEEMRFRT